MRESRRRVIWESLISVGKKALIIPPIVLGVIGYMYIVNQDNTPKLKQDRELARALSVIEVRAFDLRPMVTGFGTCEYSTKWRAVAQVSGRLSFVNRELRAGAVVKTGDVLFRIDDADYKSAVKELAASIAQTNAEIDQLVRTEQNYEKTLAIERDVLAVYETELDRAKQLLQRNAGSKSSVDAKQRSVLSQHQKVQDLENSKSLIEPQRNSQVALLAQAEAKLDQAKRDVERTVVVAPFDMRIGEVDLEEGQFVAVNEVPFEGYSIDSVEVEVQLLVENVKRIVTIPESQSLGSVSMDDIRKIFQVDVQVRNTVAGPNAVYEGQFLRTREVFDSQTRTLGLVVGVERKENESPTLGKPPLLAGAFCTVDLYGPKLANRIAIPVDAIRNAEVSVLDEDDRLVIKPIGIEFVHGDYAVISSGLEIGERLVTSNPSPAIDGMLVKPVWDKVQQDQHDSSVNESLN